MHHTAGADHVTSQFPSCRSRRQFLTSAAAVPVLAAMRFPSAAAAAPPGIALPNPIPGGLEILGNGTVFRILLPGYPPLGSPDPASNDPSLITDFNGHVGLAYVQGTGLHTNKVTGVTRRLPFEVDLRFMRGTYVGVDGKHHHATFALH
jgi:hypothetical protein